MSSGSMFPSLSADDPGSGPTEVESMCVQCGQNGITRLLLTKIPHYREVILMSFSCDDETCGFSNNEIQSAGQVQEKGVRFVLEVEAGGKDLSRQVVKSDYATLKVPEIELEIPAKSQKGAITTVEGILERTAAGLEQDQPLRKALDPEGAAQIDEYLTKIANLRSGSTKFTVILSDPSGNSFIENPCAPSTDPRRTVTYFTRSKEEDHMLGMYTQDELKEQEEEEDEVPASTTSEEPSSTTHLGGEKEKPSSEENHASESNALTAAQLENEVLRFPTNCPDCNAPAETNMKVTNIPHFKEVVIMATLCDQCGHKTNEVKSGGGIEPQGTKITLRVTDPSDMSRDVLKSETCNILLPDLDFEMGGHALGGRFTTLEGLLRNIVDNLENNPFLGSVTLEGGDTATKQQQERMAEFHAELALCIEGRKTFVFVMDDPTGNSYLQNVYAPDPDPEMTVEKYDRTFEQNEDLGLNDLKTEDYGEKEIMEKCHGHSQQDGSGEGSR